MLPQKPISPPFQSKQSSSQQPQPPISHQMLTKIPAPSPCKQECQMRCLQVETLMKSSEEMFVKYQKRKLKELYPIFLQSEIEMVAKRFWDGLTSEEKEMYAAKSVQRDPLHAKDEEKWEVKMKQRLSQNIEPSSSEDGCHNEETQTKNEYPVDTIFQQRTINPNQEQHEHGSKDGSNICLTQDFQENQNPMIVSLDENNFQGLANLNEVPQNNSQREGQILNFQQSVESSNEQALEASRQSGQSLQNDTKTSSAINENSNHAIATFETFTLVSLADIHRSGAHKDSDKLSALKDVERGEEQSKKKEGDEQKAFDSQDVQNERDPK